MLTFDSGFGSGLFFEQAFFKPNFYLFMSTGAHILIEKLIFYKVDAEKEPDNFTKV